jgi:hypothetical protein
VWWKLYILDTAYNFAKQGCQMAYFLTKYPDFGKLFRVLQWKMLVYYMFIWSIFRLLCVCMLWLFGIFFPFGYVVPRKNNCKKFWSFYLPIENTQPLTGCERTSAAALQISFFSSIQLEYHDHFRTLTSCTEIFYSWIIWEPKRA